MQPGGNEYTTELVNSHQVLAGLTVPSTPQNDEELELGLIFISNSGMTVFIAKEMLELICEDLTEISAKSTGSSNSLGGVKY
jgi:hypothetical protein